MLSRINEVTKKQEWIGVLTGTDINSDDVVSGEGLGLNETCSLTYSFKSTGYKRLLVSVKTRELLHRSYRLLNFQFSDMKENGEYPDLLDIKEVTQDFVTLYGTGLIDPQLFRKLKQEKKCNPIVWKIVNKSLKKRKGNDYEYVMDMICCYLHWKIRQNRNTYINSKRKEDLRTSNHLQVIDYLYKDVDKSSLTLENNKDWKNQPIVERLKLKTFEEYQNLFRKGFLRWEWVN